MNSVKMLFPLVVFISAQAADWPRFRGPEQNGISPETGLNAKALEGGAKVVWKGNVGTGFASITVANGRVYTMGNTATGDAVDQVWCLDASTGKEIWKHSYAEELKANLYEGGPNATPTVDGGR